MIGEPFRLPPQGAPELYKTYEVLRPRSTHTRVITCAQAGCAAYERGWVTQLDMSTDLGKAQARYIRNSSGRRFTEEPPRAGAVTVTLRFAPGQTCFAEHRVPVHREPLYRILGGDWRGNPQGISPIVRSGRDWVDDFGEHQLKIKEAHERG